MDNKDFAAVTAQIRENIAHLRRLAVYLETADMPCSAQDCIESADRFERDLALIETLK